MQQPGSIEKDVALEMRALERIVEELAKANSKFPTFSSAHEGYAVILEEMDELKAEVWKGPRDRNVKLMRNEAVQVAAMALKFLVSICHEHL